MGSTVLSVLVSKVFLVLLTLVASCLLAGGYFSSSQFAHVYEFRSNTSLPDKDVFIITSIGLCCGTFLLTLISFTIGFCTGQNYRSKKWLKRFDVGLLALGLFLILIGGALAFTSTFNACSKEKSALGNFVNEKKKSGDSDSGSSSGSGSSRGGDENNDNHYNYGTYNDTGERFQPKTLVMDGERYEVDSSGRVDGPEFTGYLSDSKYMQSRTGMDEEDKERKEMALKRCERWYNYYIILGGGTVAVFTVMVFFLTTCLVLALKHRPENEFRARGPYYDPNRRRPKKKPSYHEPPPPPPQPYVPPEESPDEDSTYEGGQGVLL